MVGDDDDEDIAGSGSSDAPSVVAGVLLALAGVALTALGVFLHIKKRDAVLKTKTSLPVVDNDFGG